MVVTDQINALRALGTDPIRKLVVPRVIAGVVMAPILTIISDFMGIIGGGIIAVFQLQVASSQYSKSITDGLYTQDVWMGLVKPFFLGFVIVSVGCHVGLRTRGGTQGVGRATTNEISIQCGNSQAIFEKQESGKKQKAVSRRQKAVCKRHRPAGSRARLRGGKLCQEQIEWQRAKIKRQR